jgi:pimeloyl-ACP methyl ester carboxylesterase
MRRAASRGTVRRVLTAVAAATAVLLGLGFPAQAASGPANAASLRLDVRHATVDGRTLAYAELGPAGVPLLLLNGTGSPMSQWDPALLAALSADRRVVVYDYPGLGGSAALPGRLSFDRLADDATALLTAIGANRADVLGWSMGGFVAQRLAVRHPGRVRALVLAGTNPGGPKAVLGPTWVQDEDSDPDAGVRDYVRTNYPAGQRDAGWAFVRRVNAAIDSRRFPPDTVPQRTYDAMVDAEDPWLRSSRNLRQLASLAVPTLVVTGAKDVVTPPANSRLIAATIPGARLVLAPDAGHSFLFQRPAATARLIAGFLS